MSVRSKLFFAVLLLIFSSSLLFSQNDINRLYGLLSAAVKIDFPRTSKDASGFLYRDSTTIYLITAKHALYDINELTNRPLLRYPSCEITFNLNYKDSVLTKRQLELNLQILDNSGGISYSDADLAILPIARFHEIDSIKGSVTYFPYIVKDIERNMELGGNLNVALEEQVDSSRYVSEGADIILLGFPTTLGFETVKQFDVSRPLVKKGIVAGYNPNTGNYILDAAAFRGNSGGPVIQLRNNSYKFVGLVIENIPVNPAGDFVGNSGYSVMTPLDEIHSLIRKLKIK